MLMRSSRSPIFNEIGDLVTVVFDRRGRTLAQTEYASIIANGAGPPLPLHPRALRGRPARRRRDPAQRRLHRRQPERRRRRLHAGLPRRRARRVAREQGPRGRHRRDDRRRLRPERARGLAGGVPHPAAQARRPGHDAAGRLGAREGEHPPRHRHRGHQVDDRRLHDRQAPRARGARPLRRRGVRAAHGLRDRRLRAARPRRARALARRRLPRRELDGLRRARPDEALPDRGRRSRSTAPSITFDFSDSRRPGARLHEHAPRLGDGRGADRVPDADERRRDRRADERGPVRAR